MKSTHCQSTNYAKYYLTLKSLLRGNAIVVDFNAYGWSINTSDNILIFYISPLMCDKDMFFTLCHEVAHHFSLVDNKLKKRYTGCEIVTNNVTTKIIKYITNLDLKDQYYSFYNKISKKNLNVKNKKLHLTQKDDLCGRLKK